MPSQEAEKAILPRRFLFVCHEPLRNDKYSRHLKTGKGYTASASLFSRHKQNMYVYHVIHHTDHLEVLDAKKRNKAMERRRVAGYTKRILFYAI